MKVLIFIFTMFLVKIGNCQLLSLFSLKHSKDSSNNMIYDRLDIKVSYEKGIYYLKSLATDSIIFRPKIKCFYEIFNDKYIIATYIDTVLIPAGTSSSYSSFPRKKAIIITINPKTHSNEFYAVNFNSKVVKEPVSYNLDNYKKSTIGNGYSLKEAKRDIAILKQKDSELYKLKRINTTKRYLIIQNNNERLFLKLKK